MKRATIRGSITEEIDNYTSRVSPLQRHPHSDRNDEATTKRTTLAQHPMRHIDDMHYTTLAVVGPTLLPSNIRQNGRQRSPTRNHVRNTTMSVEYIIILAERCDR